MHGPEHRTLACRGSASGWKAKPGLHAGLCVCGASCAVADPVQAAVPYSSVTRDRTGSRRDQPMPWAAGFATRICCPTGDYGPLRRAWGRSDVGGNVPKNNGRHAGARPGGSSCNRYESRRRCHKVATNSSAARAINVQVVNVGTGTCAATGPPPAPFSRNCEMFAMICARSGSLER